MTFTPGVQAAAPARPKWLTLAAVGVIVVGVFGIMGGLSGLAGPIIGRFHPFASMPGAPPEMAKMIDLQQKALSGPVPALTMVIGLLGIAVGALAIHSSVRVLGAQPGARLVFRRTVVALGNVELASLIVGVWMQVRVYQLMNEFTESVFARTPATAPGMDETMKTVMLGVALLGIVFALGLGLLKLGFLAWSYRYANSREVVAHLDR